MTCGFYPPCPGKRFVGPFLEVAVLTTAVCSVCRDVVHVSHGLAVVHGSWIHGVFKPCAGSGVSPYCSNFILTVAASFRVFNSRVAFAAFCLICFLYYYLFYSDGEASSLEADSDAIPQFLWFLLCTGRYLMRSFFYVSFWFAPFFSAWCFKCSSFEFFDWLEVCYARWNSAVVFL